MDAPLVPVLVIVFLAAVAGSRLSRKIPAAKFARYVHALMLAVGAVLLVKAATG